VPRVWAQYTGGREYMGFKLPLPKRNKVQYSLLPPNSSEYSVCAWPRTLQRDVAVRPLLAIRRACQQAARGACGRAILPSSAFAKSEPNFAVLPGAFGRAHLRSAAALARTHMHGNGRTGPAVRGRVLSRQFGSPVPTLLDCPHGCILLRPDSTFLWERNVSPRSLSSSFAGILELWKARTTANRRATRRWGRSVGACAKWFCLRTFALFYTARSVRDGLKSWAICEGGPPARASSLPQRFLGAVCACQRAAANYAKPLRVLRENVHPFVWTYVHMRSGSKRCM
jgi:hypothetical protein